MTVRALAGIAVLNLSLILVGGSILWGLRAWRRWADLFRLAGLSYLLGAASFTTVLTLELVIGVPFRVLTILLTGAALIGSGLLVGWWRGHRLPLRRPEWQLPRLSLFGAFIAAGLVLYLEALFRSGRLAGLGEWDAWRCWTIRAKALYYFEGLDADVFSSAACPGYPPGFSALQAVAFHAMGSVDTVTLTLQYWFLAAGFVAAVAGLLAPRVRQAILLPVLLLMLVMPSLVDRVTDGRADLPLAYMLGLAALLVGLWLEDRQTWQLAAASVLLAGAIMTKREGLLLAACVLVAALAVSWQERRRRMLPIAGASLGATILVLPWQIWLSAKELPAGGPTLGLFDLFDQLGRGAASLRLVLSTFFDYDRWLVMTVLVTAAALLACFTGARRLAGFVGAFVVASVAACTWVIWAGGFEITQDYGLNPVVRLVGGPVLALAALAPLLLEQAISSQVRTSPAQAFAGAGVSTARRTLRRAALPWVVVLVALLGYPASMLFGYSGFRLPGGLPSFPSPEDCVRAPVAGEPMRVVFGYRASYREAIVLRSRAIDAGFSRTRVGRDGCGRLRIFADGSPFAALSAGEFEKAVTAGFNPTVEGRPGG